jgi:hypothetical protein
MQSQNIARARQIQPLRTPLIGPRRHNCRRHCWPPTGEVRSGSGRPDMAAGTADLERWPSDACSLSVRRRRDHDLDKGRRRAELCTDRSAYRGIGRIDPARPNRVHLLLLRHVGEIDGGRVQLRLAGPCVGQMLVDLCQDLLRWSANTDRLVVGHDARQIGDIAVDDDARIDCVTANSGDCNLGPRVVPHGLCLSAKA